MHFRNRQLAATPRPLGKTIAIHTGRITDKLFLQRSCTDIVAHAVLAESHFPPRSWAGCRSRSKRSPWAHTMPAVTALTGCSARQTRSTARPEAPGRKNQRHLELYHESHTMRETL